MANRFFAVLLQLPRRGVNIFNRAQFGDPNGIFNTANFGRITTVVNSGATGSGTSRKLQFALRLNF
jgi:hypothetical protein